MTDQANSQNSNDQGGADVAGAAAAAAEAAKAGDKAGDKGGGDAPKSWLEGLDLPEDVRDHATVKKYAANPEGLLRGMIHLEGHMGAPAEQLVRLPKPDDAEGNAALWNRLGRPETPDKYEVKVPEGSDLDKAGVDSFLAHLHKAGPLTPAMAQAAADWYGGYAKQTVEEAGRQFKALQDTAQADLRREWGGAYEGNLDAAAEAVEKFGGADYVKYLKDSGLGDDPASIKAWAAVAKASGEPGSPDPGGKGAGARRVGGALTPAEAEAELVKFNTPGSDEYKALQDGNDPNHDHFVKKRNDLFRMKRGGAA